MLRGKQHDSLQLTETAWTPDNSNAFSEVEDAAPTISPCIHSTGGVGQYQDGASATHRGH